MGDVGDGAVRFEPLPPIELPGARSVGGCCFDMDLKQNAVYSVSTTNTARKGTLSKGTRAVRAPEKAAVGCSTFPTPITSVAFPMPYNTTFAANKVRFNDFPEFLSDVQGIFRVVPDPFAEIGVDADGDAEVARHMPTRAVERQQLLRHPHHRQPMPFNPRQHPSPLVQPPQVLQQQLTEVRSLDYGNGFGQLPLSLLGSKRWQNYSVAVSARANPAAANASVAVVGRTGHGFAFAASGGYVLRVHVGSGKWELSTGASALFSLSPCRFSQPYYHHYHHLA
jgi:hypothetical protein